MDTLSDHYIRHGKDVNACDEIDYAKKAKAFYKNRNNYQVKVDSKGVVRVYDSKKNIFASYNSDGTTKTFFLFIKKDKNISILNLERY